MTDNRKHDWTDEREEILVKLWAEGQSASHHGAMPDHIELLQLRANDGTYPIANLLKDAGLTASTSESYRMLNQGAVRIDGERVSDQKLLLGAGATHIYQVGKRRFAKVEVLV